MKVVGPRLRVWSSLTCYKTGFSFQRYFSRNINTYGICLIHFMGSVRYSTPLTSSQFLQESCSCKYFKTNVFWKINTTCIVSCIYLTELQMGLNKCQQWTGIVFVYFIKIFFFRRQSSHRIVVKNGQGIGTCLYFNRIMLLILSS